MPDATRKKKTTEEKLRDEIADLRANRPYHIHVPRDGSESFRCVSPYCEDMGSADPTTSPSGREDPDLYRRD